MMGQVVEKMKSVAPHLWGVVYALLDGIPSRQRAVNARPGVDAESAQHFKEILGQIRKMAQTLRAAFAYDNFDIDFKASQPTLEHQSTFVSATSATLIPLFNVPDINALCCSAALWAKDPRNPKPSSFPLTSEEKDMLVLHKNDTYSPSLHADRLNPRQEAFTCHIRDILAISNRASGNPIPLVESLSTKLNRFLRQGGLSDIHDPAF
ncbi:hypothetical protein BJ138DRAFT_1152991, partial [Hygrophoropsis aurantiaca]